MWPARLCGRAHEENAMGPTAPMIIDELNEPYVELGSGRLCKVCDVYLTDANEWTQHTIVGSRLACLGVTREETV